MVLSSSEAGVRVAGKARLHEKMHVVAQGVRLHKIRGNRMTRRATISVAIAFGVAALALSGCAGSPTATVTETVTVTSTPEAAPSDPVEEPSDEASSDDPVEESTPPQEEFTALKFGETLSTESTDGSTSNVTLGKPVLADCQYQSLGCEEPEIGDRVVQIPILIENTGSSVAEWSRDFFVLEFADGTQVQMGDGAAFDYTPDNALDYDAKVRVGGKLNTVLVFEAPKGPFSVLILTDDYDGEPFAAWS